MKTINIKAGDVTVKTEFSEVYLKEFTNLIGLLSNGNGYNIDSLIELLTIITPLTYDEIEALDFDDFKELSNSITDTEFSKPVNQEYKSEFIFNDIVYKSNASNNQWKPKVKEINTIEKYLKNRINNGDTFNWNYVVYIAAIIFRDEETFDDEAIQKRYNIFKDNMTVDYIAPYLTDIQKYFNI